MKHTRTLLLAAAVATAGMFTQASMADGSPTYPSFATIAHGKKMLSRDDIDKLDEKKYPALAGLKSHFDDADLDHDHNLNQYEYDHYMSNTPH
ncbi:hypothetical protein BJI69_17185 [Luteibacter rhizovicinus DSM 16549]|uniref:Uncharacterized protein n=1 Tax=Luteibacter rhizovicinus DSM 16549 TaxID=1440763 RepID=A0A0G9H1W0_9GAMM|nr:hypothetical protein [Luteibacter rhizovicinus]APG05467.1 hypothetical protein BJI69_17185 [Luteibacter rhizovicinus DSM 16549]KLD63825.1 hypothetical protein Y883_18855 [Luteibacter rhizovicinus DSM 16549]